MYVTATPNRNSPPAILLRESYREAGKVKTRTIANISHLRPAQIEALRGALSGAVSPTASPLPDSFRIERSRPHGHVAAVLGSLRQLQLESILDPHHDRDEDHGDGDGHRCSGSYRAPAPRRPGGTLP